MSASNRMLIAAHAHAHIHALGISGALVRKNIASFYLFNVLLAATFFQSYSYYILYKLFLLLLLLLSLDLSLLVLSACQMAQQRGIDSLANVTLNHFVNTRWAKGETENGWWVGYSCRKHVRKVYILNFKGSSHVTACF